MVHDFRQFLLNFPFLGIFANISHKGVAFLEIVPKLDKLDITVGHDRRLIDMLIVHDLGPDFMLKQFKTFLEVHFIMLYFEFDEFDAYIQVF